MTTAAAKPDEVRLILRPLPGGVAWPHRVRMLLKYALRVCGMRCVRVEQLPRTEEAPR